MPVHADSRGWFKEHWQREKMLALGLPDFGPVQQAELPEKDQHLPRLADVTAVLQGSGESRSNGR